MKLPFIASVIVFVELGGMILIHRDKVGKTNCDRSDFFLYHLFKVIFKLFHMTNRRQFNIYLACIEAG